MSRYPRLFRRYLSISLGLPEVDAAVPVCVVHPEDVLLQLLGVGVGVALAHHAAELLLRDLAVGVLHQEVLVREVDLRRKKKQIIG